MPDHDTSEMERRLKEVERRLASLTQDLSAVKHKAGAASQARPPSDGGNQSIYNAITTSAVTARSGTTMGSGTFNFVDSTGHTLATQAGVGTFTGYTDSATGWATAKYCRVYWGDGQWQFITADAC